MPQKRLQQERASKAAEKRTAREARQAKQLIDLELPADQFTKERADHVDNASLYVDLDNEPQPAPEGELTNDLLNAPLHLRDRAEEWLGRFARHMPDKEKWSLTGGGIDEASAVSEYMRTVEYVQLRCHSWRWREDMSVRPLCLFDDTGQKSDELYESEISTLMDSAAYLHAEMELSQYTAAAAAAAPLQLQEEPAAAAAAAYASLAQCLGAHCRRLTLNGAGLTASTLQQAELGDQVDCLFWTDTQTQRFFLLCTLLNKQTHELIAHFYIPQIAVDRNQVCAEARAAADAASTAK